MKDFLDAFIGERNSYEFALQKACSRPTVVWKTATRKQTNPTTLPPAKNELRFQVRNWSCVHIWFFKDPTGPNAGRRIKLPTPKSSFH